MNATPRPRLATFTTLAVALLLAVASTAAWSAAYRWKDADGNTVYGDQPPTGATAERLTAPPPPPLLPEPTAAPQAEAAPPVEGSAAPAAEGGATAEGSGSGAATAKQPSPEAQQVDAERRAREARQNAEAKRRNCEAARSNLATLQNPKPLRLKQDDGATRRVDDAERARMIRDTQAKIREYCN